MKSPDLDLAAIRKRCEAAVELSLSSTATMSDHKRCVNIIHDDIHTLCDALETSREEVARLREVLQIMAVSIAHARDDIPALCDALEASQREVRRLRKATESLAESVRIGYEKAGKPPLLDSTGTPNQWAVAEENAMWVRAALERIDDGQ